MTLEQNDNELDQAFEKGLNAWVEVYKGLDVIYIKELAEQTPQKADFYKARRLAEISEILEKYSALSNEITDSLQTVMTLSAEYSIEDLGYSSDQQDIDFIKDISELCIAYTEYIYLAKQNPQRAKAYKA
jgi:dissimilatory sulfite reductase (desulfoviridin) alpha/beta subunit